MRIIAMSDSHGDFSKVRRVFEENPGAGCYIHLGDGARDFEEAGWIFPEAPRKSVQGNCDFGREEPLSGLLEIEGKRIFFTHGHLWRVKDGLEELERAAREGHGAAVVFVVQMDRADWFAPNDATQPEFGQALREAQAAGVRLIARCCDVTPLKIELAKEIPVRLK